jgi:hypothetical protein
MKTRVGGLQGTAERFGDLRHRQLFDFVEDEDSALVVIELVEDPIERATRLPERDDIVLPTIVCGVGWSIGHDLASHATTPSIVGGGARTDSVDPSLDRRASFEVIELAVNDDEDFLANVLDVRLGYAESAKRAPRERGIRAEDLGERRKLSAA